MNNCELLRDIVKYFVLMIWKFFRRIIRTVLAIVKVYHFESVFLRNVAAAGRGIYIPLVPPEARAAFHFALAFFMKTAAKLCSSLRIF